MRHAASVNGIDQNTESLEIIMIRLQSRLSIPEALARHEIQHEIAAFHQAMTAGYAGQPSEPLVDTPFPVNHPTSDEAAQCAASGNLDGIASARVRVQVDPRLGPLALCGQTVSNLLQDEARDGLAIRAIPEMRTGFHRDQPRR